ncbi:hypothetical protein H7J86_31890 [Mycobacterium hackensackense]|uniref:hypothetical protein n=1 Tax=Mycobacterium hackensackense TaxID=228909 RepID=UPI002265CDAC|nr:hypothetical protein [Mycobacterium hackensackense]MCV7256788.1 hypothetical protein [Mycobacterium hackensackense]
MKTVPRQAIQLSAGDVIVDPDGNRHEVTAITIHGLSAAWLTFTTDTGLTIDKTQDSARLDTYDVITEQ